MNESIKSLSDEEALQRLIEHYDFFCQNDTIGLMDENFLPLTVSKLTERILYDAFGLTRSQIFSQPWFSREDIRFSSEQLDLRVIAIKKARDTLSPVSWLYITPRLAGTPYWAAMTKLTPLLNPPTQSFLCYELKSQPINNLGVLTKLLINRQLNLKLISGPISCGLTKNEMEINTLEHEILFMYCHDFSSPEMSEKLQQIYGAEYEVNIDNILIALVEKFELRDFSRLKSFAKRHDYINQIPTTLLSDSFIALSSELGLL